MAWAESAIAVCEEKVGLLYGQKSRILYSLFLSIVPLSTSHGKASVGKKMDEILEKRGKQTVRIAFIMLCHKNPEQINLLINKLSEFSTADIYIHVDLNCADIRDRIAKRGNTHLLAEEKSFHIQWGSVDIVKATLQLIRAVRDSGIPYDYIWLVSGQDYPICRADETERRLERNLGVNYIETIVNGNERYKWYKKLYELPYPSWINRNDIITKAIKRAYMILTGGHRHTFGIFVRKKPFDFDFAFGSQWWVLTSDAAFEILEYSDTHQEILTYYQKCIIPDECFFQTLFMRGPYSEKRAKNLTYVNWGRNRRSPETLTIEDVPKIEIAGNNYCFARKFEIPLSTPLINYLEEMMKDDQ